MTVDEKLELLQKRYNRGVQDSDTRRTRRNGWNDVIDAYMSKLPANWPHLARVTDPRVRNIILEKNSRLTNSKLQGRLIPREGGDVIKARIQNAVLDFQWDYANEGGSMSEKVALSDQIARIYGAAFVLVYWNAAKNTNEIKLINPNDIFFDGSATHIKNAKYAQVREWTTWEKLEERGYNVARFRRGVQNGSITPNRKDTAYVDEVKANRALENRIGEQDDPKNPVVEVVTQWKNEECTLWLPKYDIIVKDEANPYAHKQIPIAQLRYYPLGDDIMGESEVESVLPLQRAINFFLSGTVDALGMAIRPPLKLVAGQYRKESIEYGPGANMIVSNPNAVTEMQLGDSTIKSFNTIYPALVAAFNTAMGDQSLGMSTYTQKFGDKTATEVEDLAQQQNTRDQSNQFYLGQFLKDIILMWNSNNKQYLFDDPTKDKFVLKIIGKDNIQYFQQMKLADSDVPDYAMAEIAQTIEQNPEAVDDGQLTQLMSELSVPTHPIINNPNEKNPTKYDFTHKFSVSENGDEGDLIVTPDDYIGEYDYIPDVKSMSAGAGVELQEARKQALETIMNPAIQGMLQTQGENIKIKELLVNVLEDAGYKDAEALFENVNQQALQGGGIDPTTGAPLAGNVPNAGVQGGVPPIPNAGGPGGIPQPQGVQGQIPA